MALYGQNLSKYVPASLTWSQGTDICAVLEDAARASYSVFSDWDNVINHGLVDAVRLSFLNNLDRAQTEQLKAMMDSDYAKTLSLDQLIQEKAGQLGWDASMASDYVEVLRDRVASASDMQKFIDDWFSVSIGGALSDSVTSLVGGVSGTIANGVSKVAGNLLGGLWWVLLLAGVGLVLWFKFKPKIRVSA